MMSGKVTPLALIVLALFAACMLPLALAASPALANDLVPVSSEQLIDHPDVFDNERVLYTGEVVGEVLRRGDYAWLTVNDDDYGQAHMRREQELEGGNTGLGVYCSWGDAERIRFVGGYNALGDMVEVTGTFHKASAEHGGEMMIEAEDVRVVRPGHAVGENDYGGEPVLAVILGVIALGLGGAFLLVRLRRGGIGA